MNAIKIILGFYLLLWGVVGTAFALVNFLARIVEVAQHE